MPKALISTSSIFIFALFGQANVNAETFPRLGVAEEARCTVDGLPLISVYLTIHKIFGVRNQVDSGLLREIVSECEDSEGGAPEQVAVEYIANWVDIYDDSWNRNERIADTYNQLIERFEAGSSDSYGILAADLLLFLNAGNARQLDDPALGVLSRLATSSRPSVDSLKAVAAIHKVAFPEADGAAMTEGSYGPFWITVKAMEKQSYGACELAASGALFLPNAYSEKYSAPEHAKVISYMAADPVFLGDCWEPLYIACVIKGEPVGFEACRSVERDIGGYDGFASRILNLTSRIQK
ncbi:MAG: hypothetical protein N4A53_01435 [Pelagimonas sp.]|nr:hypothetical protein [Pelagimonas sp.]